MIDKNKTIMYVDDDADDRELLADAIKHADPELVVLLAENGLEALKQLATMKESNEKLPCLIVLDINMPYIDGKETFDLIKQDTVLKQVPVMVFSSSEKPQDKMLFNNLGIEFFTKPSNLSYMNKIVNHMISVCC